MIKHFCDLCGEEINSKWYHCKFPIAATWINLEPCDTVPMEFEVCNHCKNKIYKVIEKIIPESRLKELNKRARDIATGLIDE